MTLTSGAWTCAHGHSHFSGDICFGPDNSTIATGDGTGLRHDTGKARFDLLPAGPLRQVAMVFTKGAEKYADRNWEKGMRWGKHYAALQRHLNAFWQGEDFDPESGLEHLAHAVFGCLALMEYMETYVQGDDRTKKDQPGKGFIAIDPPFDYGSCTTSTPETSSP